MASIYDMLGITFDGGPPPGTPAPPGSDNSPPSGGGDDVGGAAAQYAQQREGYRPRRVMQEGQVTYQNGVPGVMIKYDTPNGSSTEWTAMPDYKGGPNIDPVEWGNNGQVSSGGPGGGGGGGGGAFYEQMKSMLKAQGVSDLSNTQAAIRKALVGFGLDPSNQGYEDKLGALDPVTKSLIAKNTESGISYYARMLEGKKDNLRALIANLSKTGMRRSGAKGARLRKGQLDFDRLFQDSLQELLGQVGGMYSSYAGNEQQRQMQLLQALQNSSSQYSSNPSSYPSGNPNTVASGTPMFMGRPLGAQTFQQIQDFQNSNFSAASNFSGGLKGRSFVQ